MADAEINELLLQIDGPALSKDFRKVDDLVQQTRDKLNNARGDLGEEVAATLERSLTDVERLSFRERNPQPEATSYKAGKNKTGIKPFIFIASTILNWSCERCARFFSSRFPRRNHYLITKRLY